MTNSLSLEGWRDFAEAPALEQPERLSAKQIEALSEDARVAYDYHRERYHANFLVKIRQVVRLNGRLWDLLDANQQGPSRVKGAAVIDSPPGLGKTTAVDAFGRAFHQRQILRHGRDFDDGQTLHIPVCRVAFSGKTTTRALNESILNFYNHPSRPTPRGADTCATETWPRRQPESVRRHGTRLIIVDDVHFLKIHTDEGVALANELNGSRNEYPATFLFTGVNMTSTGLQRKQDRQEARDVADREGCRCRLFLHSR
ncbi:AAA family ATPase, partial [Microbacterium aurum]